MEKSGNVLIIGLDGATWDVLTPLVKSGKLRNLKNLIENGVSGELESVFPPVTGPAWLSMATGKNPGKTGIFDFLNRRNKDYSIESISSSDFIANGTYWDYLNAQGVRVGILNHAMLYPPYQINGFMVSGLGSSSKDKITYPPDLKEKLDRVTGGYEIIVSFNNPKYYNSKKLLVNDLRQVLNKRVRAIEYCLRKYNVELTLLVFQVPDILQHCLWADWENPESEFHEDFVSLWELLDNSLGRIMEIADEDSTIIVLSDHGFGPLTENFLINKWLEIEGYLKRARWINAKKLVRVTLEKFKPMISDLLPSFSNSIRDKLSKNFLEDSIFGKIDIERTIAFSGGSNSTAHGAIYIRDPNREDYNKIASEIISRLKEFGRQHNPMLNIECYRAADFYWGDRLRLAPDILFKINNHRCNIQTNKLDGEIFSANLPMKNKSGAHRKEGIFICSGPNIKKGISLSGANLLDVAPTILYLFGYKHPKSMDGRVLKEIFRDSLIRTRKLQELKLDNLKKAVIDGMRRTHSEELEIRERLRNLGYLD